MKTRLGLIIANLALVGVLLGVSAWRLQFASIPFLCLGLAIAYWTSTRVVIQVEVHGGAQLEIRTVAGRARVELRSIDTPVGAFGYHLRTSAGHFVVFCGDDIFQKLTP
jgi:hypothetical protein